VSSLPAYLVAASGQSYQLEGKTAFLIGREDAVSGIFPDVDTMNTGGFEQGVGRRHAEIVQQGSQWLLRDLNSVNGTWVNNVRLAPNALQPLKAGDRIRLGNWTATFQQ
jgi:pSer/pThr/pTyr-binding forkhead associated (FHA) protein